MSTKNSEIKKRVIRLRKKGSSYREIKEKTGVPKSTLSYWLKNISLDKKSRERLYTKQILNLSRGPKSQKERRKREICKITEEAKREIKLPLSSQTYKLFGAALYWAEGSKKHDFAITNSDPHLVLFMVRWLEEVLGIPPQRLKASLNIYSQQNEKSLKKFWSDLTKIPLDNFNKSYIKPPNKAYKKNNLYYGTIKIRVSKGIDMRYRLFGWIKAVMDNVAPEIELSQRRWEKIRKVSRPVNLPKEK